MLAPTWLSLAILSTAGYASARGQFPVVNGVIGGIPVNGFTVQSENFTTAATTPGALRVTENSGVCGMSFPSSFPTAAGGLRGVIYLETTPGVYSASGYGDLTATKSIW